LGPGRERALWWERWLMEDEDVWLMEDMKMHIYR
jgi:hypothetical protein